MSLGRKRQEEEAEIDLTPMLDVVFIMLIFFIVTASFVKESGIDVNRPPAVTEQQQQTENKNILFIVTESGDVMLEGRRIDIRSVRANVERLHAENPEAKVVVSAHPNSKTDIFIRISDQAREAGVRDISLATK